MLPLSPVSTTMLPLQRIVQIRDLRAYRKFSQTLPHAELLFLRLRAKTGDVEVAEQLFHAGGTSSWLERGEVARIKNNAIGYTWACVQTTWWEKGGAAYGLVPGSGWSRGEGKGLVLEVGLAVLRCANLRAVVRRISVVRLTD